MMKKSIIIGLIALFIYKLHSCLEINACLDMGHIWDEKESRCRNDCLALNEKFGCIKLTEAQILLFENCRYKTPDCYRSTIFNGIVDKEICFQNNKAWNAKSKNCDFYFKKEQCFALGADWEYPSVCKD